MTSLSRNHFNRDLQLPESIFSRQLPLGLIKRKCRYLLVPFGPHQPPLRRSMLRPHPEHTIIPAHDKIYSQAVTTRLERD
jgi:hypothetical protein